MERNRGSIELDPAPLPSRDEQAALQATGGDPELARELFQALVRNLTEELSDLRRHFQERDWPTLADAAHRMRGATSYCGVPALDNCLLQLERTAKNGDGERAAVELARVEREAEKLSPLH